MVRTFLFHAPDAYRLASCSPVVSLAPQFGALQPVGQLDLPFHKWCFAGLLQFLWVSRVTRISAPMCRSSPLTSERLWQSPDAVTAARGLDSVYRYSPSVPFDLYIMSRIAGTLISTSLILLYAPAPYRLASCSPVVSLAPQFGALQPVGQLDLPFHKWCFAGLLQFLWVSRVTRISAPMCRSSPLTSERLWQSPDAVTATRGLDSVYTTIRMFHAIY